MCVPSTFRFHCFWITSFLYKMRGAGCCFKALFVEDKICFTWIYFAGFAFENFRKPFLCGGRCGLLIPVFSKALKWLSENTFLVMCQGVNIHGHFRIEFLINMPHLKRIPIQRYKYFHTNTGSRGFDHLMKGQQK